MLDAEVRQPGRDRFRRGLILEAGEERADLGQFPARDSAVDVDAVDAERQKLVDDGRVNPAFVSEGHFVQMGVGADDVDPD